MRTRSTGLIIATSIVLASCGGSGNGDSTPPPAAGGGGPSNPPASASIGPQGGSLGLADGTQVDIAAGALGSAIAAAIAKESSEEEAGAFAGAASIFGPLTADVSALSITVETDSLPEGSVSVKLPITDELVQRAAAGQQLILFSTRPYELEGDDEKSEANDVVEAIPLSIDGTARQAIVALPASAFDGRTGKLIANLRIAALPLEESIAADPLAARSTAQRASPLATPTPLACPGDASFKAPMLYGWRDVPAPADYYDTIAGIIGAFAETVGHTGAAGHAGLDFFADVGTPVYAVATGYVEKVKHQHWDCPGEGTAVRSSTPVLNRRKQATIPHPNYEVTLAVTDATGAVVDRVRYLHLSFNSVRIRGRDFDPDFERCWTERNPRNPRFRVNAEDYLAQTGRNGTAPNGRDQVGPHLHLEWKPTRARSVRNPMCKLSTIFLARFGASGWGANQPELSYRMYGWAPPGLAAQLPGPDASNLVEFWVRRQRPAGNPAVCLQNFGPNQVIPCDWGGKGSFTYPLVQAVEGQWEPLSRAEVTRVEVAPSSLLANPFVTHPSPEPDRITQAPNVGTFSPIKDGLSFPTQCGTVLDWTWMLTLPFTTTQSRTQFGPAIRMRRSLVQDQSGNCLPFDTQISP